MQENQPQKQQRQKSLNKKRTLQKQKNTRLNRGKKFQQKQLSKIDPQINLNNIRIQLQNFNDDKTPQIFDQLIFELAKCFPQQQQRKKFEEYTKLSCQLKKNENKYLQNLNYDQMIKSSIETLEKQTIQTQKKIDEENQTIRIMKQKKVYNQELLKRFGQELQMKKSLKQKQKKLQDQLSKIRSQSISEIQSDNQKNIQFQKLIKQKFDDELQHLSKKYEQINNLESEMKQIQKQLLQAKQQLHAKNQTYHLLLQRKNKLQNQVKRLQNKIQKRKNYINRPMSQIPDTYPLSNIYVRDSDHFSDKTSQHQLEYELNNQRGSFPPKIRENKKVYHYEQPSNNRYCEFLIFLFAIILVISFFTNKSSTNNQFAAL